MHDLSRLAPDVRLWSGRANDVALHPTRAWIARVTDTHTEVLDTQREQLVARWTTRTSAQSFLRWCGDRLVEIHHRDGVLNVRAHRLPAGELVAETKWEEPNGLFAPQMSANGDVLFIPGKDATATTCRRGTWVDTRTLHVRATTAFVVESGVDWPLRDLQIVGLHPDGRSVTRLEESLETSAWRIVHHGDGPAMCTLAFSPPSYDGLAQVQWLHAGALVLHLERNEFDTCMETLMLAVEHGEVWQVFPLTHGSSDRVFRWSRSPSGERLAAAFASDERDVDALCVHDTRDGRALASRRWDPAWGSLMEITWDANERVVATAVNEDHVLLVRWRWESDEVTVAPLPPLPPHDVVYPVGAVGDALVLTIEPVGVLVCG